MPLRLPLTREEAQRPPRRSKLSLVLDWLDRILLASPALFVTVLGLFLTPFFAWTGYQAWEAQRSLRANAVTATATVAEYRGSFQKGRRVRRTVHNYLIEYDGYVFYKQWERELQLGDRFGVVYDKTNPVSVELLDEYEPTGSNQLSVEVVLIVGLATVTGVAARKAYRRIGLG